MAARRAFQSEPNVRFICGDARFLPFKDNIFGCVFSYPVVQHFSERDRETTVAEIGRVLSQNGYSRIQMAHRGGLRSTYMRTRSDYVKEEFFVCDIGLLWKLMKYFRKVSGQRSSFRRPLVVLDYSMMTGRLFLEKGKMLVIMSIVLKKVARVVRPLIWLADSVYVVSTKR